MPPLLLGLGLATLAAVAARLTGLLTVGGAVAAAIIGTAVFEGGGWALALTLIAAFAVTGAATRHRRREKIQPDQPEHRRGRSAIQVVANGITPATLAVSGAVFDLPWALAGAAGAIAASTADTLATEIGLLSATPPRLITTGKKVPRGRSGGMTGVGTISGVGGALFVAAIFDFGREWASVAVGGFAGMVIDSLLGATVQARYQCPACGAEGELKECSCGSTRTLSGGISWMTNDAVNLVMAAAGAAIAALLAR